MSRITAMTVGLVFILLGVQFCLVKTYYLSPKTTRLLAEHFTDAPSNAATNNPSSNWKTPTWPFYESAANGTGTYTAPSSVINSLTLPVASYGQKRVAPPRWLRWSFLFLGVVFFLHGAALRNE